MATEDKLRDYLKRATVELAETRQRLAEVTSAQAEPIAVIGMACRYPGGETTGEFWDLLRTGRETVADVPPSRWDVEDYYDPDRRSVGSVYTRKGAFLSDIAGWDAELFGLSPLEALRMDPQQRLLMELAWEGFEDAGTPPADLAGSRTAVMVGLMDSGQYGRLEMERLGPGVVADPYFGQGVSTNVAAGRLAYQFDLRGPTMTLDTACSSSLVGVHLALGALRKGECDLAVAAGAFLIIQPDTYVQSCATSMLAPDGRCKTFDQRADGYVLGEGGGLVVLERLSTALRKGRRIRAVLRGSAVNQDGRSNGLTAPSRPAQVEVITRALADAGVRPDELSYLEAHGSGTRLGDAIELAALHDVFGKRSAERPLHVGAVKTTIGHTQSAAGIAGLIKTVLVLENGAAPANLNLVHPADAIPADGTVRPATSPVTLDEDAIAGVSAFGWSGTNAHVVVQAAPARELRQPAEPPAPVLPVSAATGPALRAQLSRLADRLDTGAGDGEHPATELADTAHTLQTGRPALAMRRAVAFTDRADAVRRLRAAAEDGVAVPAKKRPRVAFLLPGTGDQYLGLGRDLYAGEPVFAAAVDECVMEAEQRCGVDLRPLLFPREDDAAQTDGDLATLLGRAVPASAEDVLERAELAHPFLFTVEYALAKLLAHWGITPDVLIGYSLGEYVAACLAGVFSLSDALYVVGERARLIGEAPAGRMLAVAADADSLASVLAGAEVDIAALNGPAMTVLSGTAERIEAVGARLAAAGVAGRPLRSAHAFHSSLLAPVREELAALVDKVNRREPSVTIVSNSTGTALTAAQAMNPGYWAEHLVAPVRFAEGIRHCLDHEVDLFVELGPGQTLGGLVRQNLVPSSRVAVFGTLPAAWPAGRRTDLAELCARLWEHGVPFDWRAAGGGGRLRDLPTYPFQRTRFWPEPTGTPAPGSRRGAGPSDHGYLPTWHRDPGAPRADGLLPAPAGPVVIFADQDGVGARLAELATAAGAQVLEVVPGTRLRHEGGRMEIDPADPAHYREVFAAACPDAAGGEAVVSVVHLWSLRATQRNPVYAADAELEAAIEYGFDSLLLAVQALGDRTARLLTVSRGASEILGGEVTAPQQSVAHGFGRALRHEYANLEWRGVDLDPESAPRPAGALLGYELCAGGDDAQPGGILAGWRRGRRWTAGWTAEPDSQSTVDGSESSHWRADGVYLITGGTRGLGMTLARHLVRAGVRRLALVGRSSLRRDVPAEPDSAAAGALAAVAGLENDGAEVLLLTADAGDPGQLRAALRDCREHFGSVHGVIHAAGLPAGGMARRSTPAEARTVLAPKILAMGPLAELVGPETPVDQRPELLVLYSSAVTAFGGIGEGDYCAANTVLDSYGTALASLAPSTKVLTVSWGPWLHDAWQTGQTAGNTSALAERARAYRERYGFTDEAGCALLDRALRGGGGTVLALRQSIEDSLGDWSAMVDLDALVEASVLPPSGERFPRPHLRTEYVAPRTELESTLAEVWQAHLGIEQVGVHDPFFDLGGNSLVGLAMVLAVEKRLDTSIAPAMLFEHATVAEFAAALASAADDGASSPEAVATSSERGQRRRRARTKRGNEG